MKEIYVEGLKELNRQLEQLQAITSRPELKKAAYDAAAVLGREVKRRAPRGPTENLRGSVIWFGSKKATEHRAISVMKINVPGKGRPFRRGMAPHAYLVEYGTTGPRVSKTGGLMKIPMWKFLRRSKARNLKRSGNFGFIFANQVAKMPASHFFRDGVAAATESALRALTDGVQRAVVAAVK